MLLNSLYTIDEFHEEAQNIVATLTLDPLHEIFKGHFASQPVLPGVCLIEMLKDLIKKATGRAFAMKEASNIKYLMMVDPQQNVQLRFEIKMDAVDNTIKVVATSFLENNEINFKFKGTFV
jgi:3-hydroxyacyl-[acyl-carrier-protein] dehydratase